VAVIKEKITHSNENIVWKACLADLYEKCYDYANALNMLDIMIAEYNSEHELYCSRAMYYSELGIMDRALEDIGKSIELSGEEDAAYYCV
jgi:tetratricopeptide (TPR) repeat protein